MISFFDKQNSGQKNRYRHRKNLGAGHALAIIKACLQVYHSLEEDYALIFSAANDIGQIEEDNARYSAYLKVIARYFKNIEQYNQQGSIKLNTLMLYHQSFQYKQEANQFYQEFEQQVEDNLVETDDEK